MFRASMFLFGLLFVTTIVTAADSLDVLAKQVDGQPASRMMHDYLLRSALSALDRADAKYEKLKTPEQIAEYQQRMREFFVSRLGGFPERTPLNARVTGKEDRDGYRVEKIIYESQPKHYVTALLYLPNTKPPYPGVLVPCGHSNNGKAYPAYQRVSILLAKNGLAALCFDPIRQGERHQLLDKDGKPLAATTGAHCLAGVGSTLVGRNTAMYMIWDGMRGIDYLQSRPDIDPERIGCTGNSGGGTQTSYLMAIDRRIKCAAPSCYLTSLRRLYETIGPQDAEQNIDGQVAFGMGHAEYIIMRAPKPTLICTATRDFFDIGGSWTTYRKAKRIYTRLDFAERVDLIETDDKHGFSTKLRVGAVRWMRRWLLNIDGAINEPDSPVVTDEQCFCTPKGKVMLMPNTRTTYDLNIELNEKLAKVRAELWKAADKSKAMKEVRRVVGIKELDKLPKLECKKVGQIERPDYKIEKLVLKPEKGIALPALAFVPKKSNGKTYLYLNAKGKQVDAGPDGPIEKLVKQGALVLAVDLRGLGETELVKKQKNGISRYMGDNWQDIYMGFVLDRPFLAMRTEDVLNCARFLSTYESGGKSRPVHLISIDRTGPPALHAAALEPQLFASVVLKNCLVSWTNLLSTPFAKERLGNVALGALKVYDLPDLLTALPKEKVTVIEPVDGLDNPISSHDKK